MSVECRKFLNCFPWFYFILFFLAICCRLYVIWWGTGKHLVGISAEKLNYEPRTAKRHQVLTNPRTKLKFSIRFPRQWAK